MEAVTMAQHLKTWLPRVAPRPAANSLAEVFLQLEILPHLSKGISRVQASILQRSYKTQILRK
jgi:hypothetical protein